MEIRHGTVRQVCTDSDGGYNILARTTSRRGGISSKHYCRGLVRDSKDVEDFEPRQYILSYNVVQDHDTFEKRALPGFFLFYCFLVRFRFPRSTVNKSLLSVGLATE